MFSAIFKLTQVKGFPLTRHLLSNWLPFAMQIGPLARKQDALSVDFTFPLVVPLSHGNRKNRLLFIYHQPKRSTNPWDVLLQSSLGSLGSLKIFLLHPQCQFLYSLTANRRFTSLETQSFTSGRNTSSWTAISSANSIFPASPHSPIFPLFHNLSISLPNHFLVLLITRFLPSWE